MIRIALTVLLCSSLLSCAGPPQSAVHRTTLRPLGMTSEQFVEAANKVIFRAAHEWYAPATHTIHMRLSWHDTGRYARMGRRDDGTYSISVDRSALSLPVIEDMAHVLMHEYIHVKVWKVVYSMDLTRVCKELRSEMIANRVMIEEYHAIGYRRDLLTQAVSLYARSRAQARTECPPEAWFDQPMWPLPRKVKERKITPRWEEFQRDLEREQRIMEERIKVPIPTDRYQP